jgi:tetratricopeptide (TPR) repeat protein
MLHFSVGVHESSPFVMSHFRETLSLIAPFLSRTHPILLLLGLAVPLVSFAVAGSQSTAKQEHLDPLRQHYSAAQNYEKAGDKENAAVEYRAFLEEALHRVANGKAQAGEFDAALPLFDEALSFSPQDPNLLLDYAAACLTADKLLQAKALAEKATQVVPKSERAQFLFGRILFHLEDYEGAKVQLQAAVAANPDFDTGYLLGRTYLLLHEDKEAGALFAQMTSGLGDTALIHIYFGQAYSNTDYLDSAVEEFKKAISKDSHALSAHYHLALAYLGHNEEAGYDKALPELRAELKINPDDFSSHYMLGYIALKQRNFAEAESELTRAAALNPQDLGTMLQLAVVYNETNRPPQAEAILRKAVAAAETVPAADAYAANRVHYMLGQLLERSGRQEEGLSELKIFAEREKRRHDASGSVAEERTMSSGSLARKERSDQPDQKKATDVSPEQLKQLDAYVEQVSPAIADAYNNLGALSAERNDFAGAVRNFQQARDWDSSLEGIDRNLGAAFFYAGQYQTAVQTLGSYLEAHPQDLQARSMLSLSLFQSGDYANVIHTLDAEPSLPEKDPRLGYVYAVALVKTRQYSAGIERLKTLESANPNSPQIQTALADALAAQQSSNDTQNPKR